MKQENMENKAQRKRWRPYFMQSPQRKKKEFEIAKRAIKIACAKADYCVNICAYANLEMIFLDRGVNPRSIISNLRREVMDSIKNPDYRPTNFPDSAHEYVLVEREMGNPAYCNREFRKARTNELLKNVTYD